MPSGVTERDTESRVSKTREAYKWQQESTLWKGYDMDIENLDPTAKAWLLRSAAAKAKRPRSG